MSFITSEAIKDLVCLSDNPPSDTIARFISSTSCDLIEQLCEVNSKNEKVLEKLPLLTAFMEYYTKLDLEQLPNRSLKQLFELWELLITNYTYEQNFQIVNVYLVKCMCLFEDSTSITCCGILQALVSNAFSSLPNDIIKVLNLMEAFLICTNKRLENTQKMLLIKLCDVLLGPDDVISESTYLVRMTGLLSSVLKSTDNFLTSDKIWKIIFDALVEKGLPFVKAKTSQYDCSQSVSISSDIAAIQYCLVLLDILLEVAHSRKLLEKLDNADFNKTVILLSQPVTWVTIQYGLCHKKSFARKQALYTLRRALFAAGESSTVIKSFFCDSDPEKSCSKFTKIPLFSWDTSYSDILLSFWKEFLLVSETLDENQLHVITPVLGKFSLLINRTNSESTKNKICIHTSWICTLLQRMMSHESKAIIREGILTSLQLDPTIFPFLHQETGKEFLESLIPALQDVNLYCDFKDHTLLQPDQGEVPVVAKHLRNFVENCCKLYKNPEEFLNFILKSIAQFNWGSVPLYYVTSSLSNLPISSVWSGEDLQILQNLIMRCMRTHDIRLRHIIQNVLLRPVMKYTDCSKVILDEILTLLMVCDVKKFFDNYKKLWSEICEWIYNNLSSFKNIFIYASDDVCLFTLKNLEKYCSSTSVTDHQFSVDEYLSDSRSSAVLILIVEKALASSIDFINNILTWLNDIIEKSSTHLYMSKEKVYKTISITNHLVTSWTKTRFEIDGTSTYNNLFKILRSLQSYIILQFPTRSTSFEDANLCLNTWKRIFECLELRNSKCDWPQQLATEFASMISISRNIIMSMKNGPKTQGNSVTIVLAVKCISWICHLRQDASMKFDVTSTSYMNDYLGFLDLDVRFLPQNSTLDKGCGKAVEQYSMMQWSCVSIAIDAQNKENIVLLDPMAGLRSFLSQLDTVTEHNLQIYFDALRALIAETLKSTDEECSSVVCDCLNVSWKTVCALAHNPSFWKSYKSFISAALQIATLSQPRSSIVQENIANLLSEIAIQSISKTGLMQFASAACIESWTGCTKKDEHGNIPKYSHMNGKGTGHFDPQIHSKMIETHLEFVVQCLTFCYMHKKEDLAILNVLKLSNYEDENNTGSLKDMSDHHVTLSTIVMILRLDSKSQQDCSLGNEILKQLLNLDESLTKKKLRYHHHTVQHYMKNKIYQAVILLLCFVLKIEAENIVNFLIKNLKNDAQPSVRYLMEWSLAVLIIRFPCHENLLLNEITGSESEDGSSEGTANYSAVCSYLTASVLVGLCKSPETQDDYFLHLINICLPWCMSQHFSIRLYALAVVLRIKIYFESEGKLTILLSKHPSIPACLMFADKATGNVRKNWIKMKSNFFIFDLRPLEDLSVETVYVDIPRLCCIPNHVTVNELENLHEKFGSGVQLLNTRDSLRNRKSTEWIPQESKQLSNFVFNQSDRYRKNYSAEETSDDKSSQDNVQKKIMPWLDVMDISADHSEQKVRPEGLILVASLIDKLSNLGGLTRTCEIFGAEALVVEALTCISDKTYQSLSVTAHKWLPMKEVKPWQLEEYLPLMRNKGYTLIGTEQTAQSVCLSKYRFPKKCVVVLGNEKEGIPISILKLLDVCVQIPQKGIVRSLNVHVSGAITVWEYARQYL